MTDRSSRRRAMRLSPLLEEVLVAAVSMLGLSTVIAVLYRVITGLSPWPGLMLGLLAGFGFGVAILAFTSPRRHD